MSLRAEARRQQIEAHARDIWEERELEMWGRTRKWRRFRQTWEQGTELARQATMLQAAQELGYIDSNTVPKVEEREPCPNCDDLGYTVRSVPRCCGGSDWECGASGCTGPIEDYEQEQCPCVGAPASEGQIELPWK